MRHPGCYAIVDAAAACQEELCRCHILRYDTHASYCHATHCLPLLHYRYTYRWRLRHRHIVTYAVFFLSSSPLAVAEDTSLIGQYDSSLPPHKILPPLRFHCHIDYRHTPLAVIGHA